MNESQALELAATAARIGFHVGEIIEATHPTLTCSIADLCSAFAEEAAIIEKKGEAGGWDDLDYPMLCDEAAESIVGRFAK